MNNFGWEAIRQLRPSKARRRCCAAWEKPPEKAALRVDEAHVWLVSLGLEFTDVASLTWLVSAEERERAESFRFLKDKKEYLATKIYLRLILSKYLNCSPTVLNFKQNEYGKPSISNETNDLKFSVSHSGGCALFALARGKEVGIDLESFDSAQPAAWIDEDAAIRSLTKTELKKFLSLPAGERRAFFYRCWTRKEAFSKAAGKGFIIEPNQIETTSSLLINNEIDSACGTFYDLPKINNFQSALVVEGNQQINPRFFKL